MRNIFHLHDGSRRPGWAGAVKHHTYPHPSHPHRSVNHVEGVILPVQVEHQSGHTFGMGLGLPNLSGHILQPGPESRLASHWSQFEDQLSQAAQNVMGWHDKLKPHAAQRADVPSAALHLALHSGLQAGHDDHPEPYAVTGTVTRVAPIFDAAGKRVRMRRDGPTSRFKLTPRNLNWTTRPEGLR